MTDEERELFEAYKKETEKCYEIANKLDQNNPELPGAFTGTPSERILRQIAKYGVTLNGNYNCEDK